MPTIDWMKIPTIDWSKGPTADWNDDEMEKANYRLKWKNADYRLKKKMLFLSIWLSDYLSVDLTIDWNETCRLSIGNERPSRTILHVGLWSKGLLKMLSSFRVSGFCWLVSFLCCQEHRKWKYGSCLSVYLTIDWKEKCRSCLPFMSQRRPCDQRVCWKCCTLLELRDWAGWSAFCAAKNIEKWKCCSCLSDYLSVYLTVDWNENCRQTIEKRKWHSCLPFMPYRSCQQ